MRSLVILTALMCALAFGAVWAVISRMSGNDLPWLGIFAAVGMLWSVHSTARDDSSLGNAILVAFGTLLAAFYNECLGALMRLSGELGLPLLEVLRTAGLSTAFDLGRISIHGSDIVWYLLAAAVAFALSWSLASAPVDDDHGTPGTSG